MRASLLQLRAIGVRVSLDDFGTGHSSLAYLRQFPLDSLKVDRSFVRGIEDNGDMASIVNAVKSMAHQLGLRVVAEGIEKDEQVALLRALDCEMGQGYLFSRPVSGGPGRCLAHGGPAAPRAGGGRRCCPRCRCGLSTRARWDGLAAGATRTGAGCMPRRASPSWCCRRAYPRC